jgi:hypothetical protein
MEDDDNNGVDEVTEGEESESEREEENLPTPAAAAAGYTCTTCGAVFARKFNRDRHVQLTHNNIVQVSVLLC